MATTKTAKKLNLKEKYRLLTRDLDWDFSYEDKKTAQEFIENTQALLWIIALDSNGTISNSDLNFLSELDVTDKKLFIILNKADLKPLSDIESIMNEIQERLNDYGIEFLGISAYSSINKEEITFISKSLEKEVKNIPNAKAMVDIFGLSTNKEIDQAIADKAILTGLLHKAVNRRSAY